MEYSFLLYIFTLEVVIASPDHPCSGEGYLGAALVFTRRLVSGSKGAGLVGSAPVGPSMAPDSLLSLHPPTPLPHGGNTRG